MVHRCDQRRAGRDQPGHSEPDSDRRAKRAAELSLVDVGSLNDRRANAEIDEDGGESGEHADHADQPEVGRKQDASQYDGYTVLDDLTSEARDERPGDPLDGALLEIHRQLLLRTALALTKRVAPGRSSRPSSYVRS